MESTHVKNPLFTEDAALLQDVAHRLRIESVLMTTAANSGHPSTCASMAELMAVLFFHPTAGMRYTPEDPRKFTDDRFILSKGHAAPILYAVWALNGFIDPAELPKLRSIDHHLEGHPHPRAEFVDVATGSLGQGLPMACGMAYASKYFDKIDNHYWTMLGDAEINEGSIWEGVNFAGYYQLHNLTAILDVNRLGQSAATMYGLQVDIYQRRFESFGWHAIIVDGQNCEEIIAAYKEARKITNQPTVVISKSLKGKHLTDLIEDKPGWHGKPVGKDTDKVIAHLKSLIKNDIVHQPVPRVVPKVSPHPAPKGIFTTIINEQQPNYKLGDNVATRKAFGNAIRKIAASDKTNKFITLDADVKNSTFTETALEIHGANFVDVFISEELMVSLTIGFWARGKVPFAATFGVFIERGTDQLRIGGISGASIKLCGSHCGITIGKDGPSHMAMEDIAVFRGVFNSIVLFPSDAVSAEYATQLCVNYHGPAYLRTLRAETPVLYGPTEEFAVGKCKVHHAEQDAEICLVSAGAILPETLQAAKLLLNDHKIKTSVIDVFSVKPIDAAKITEVANHSKKRILVIEDNYRYGNVFSAVAEGLSTSGIAIHARTINELPSSGEPRDLLNKFGLTAPHIRDLVLDILAGKAPKE